MAIRILISRVVDPGNEVKLNTLLWQLRAKAMQAGGYISGETLRSLDDPNSFLVSSTWNSLDEWKAWEANRERKALQDEIDRLLRFPSKTQLYIYG